MEEGKEQEEHEQKNVKAVIKERTGSNTGRKRKTLPRRLRGKTSSEIFRMKNFTVI